MERTKIKKQAKEINSGYTWKLFWVLVLVRGVANLVAVASMLVGIVNFVLSKFVPGFQLVTPVVGLALTCVGLALTFFVIPLGSTLDGMFVRFVRLGKTTVGDSVGFCFRTSWKHFFKLFWSNFVVQLIVSLWSILLFFPGIIVMYRYRFINQVVIDNPGLSTHKARKICREITRGGKGKCFVLDLSFVLWRVFSALLLGIPGIYLFPYIGTVNALYYENLKIIAVRNGRVEAGQINCAVVTNYQPQHAVQQNALGDVSKLAEDKVAEHGSDENPTPVQEVK